MSLRNRVVAAVVLIALVLVGVLVFVARITESNLIAQVDEQLIAAVRPVRDVGFLPDRGRAPQGDDVDAPARPGRRELSSLYVAFVRAGTVTTAVTPGLRDEDVALPLIDASDVRTAAQAGEPFTVPSDGSDLRWRLRASPGIGGAWITVIGLPLDTVDDAISDLVVLELIGAGVILIVLALVAIWVIRLGVRPVRSMTEMATAIAAGDLTRRVPDTDRATEAGQLGAALNAMLASIETTFAERKQVEEGLRRFVADASHELRTPVATIRGYAELHRVGALQDDDAIEDAMRRTEQEAIRMGGLVDDLLTLARLDRARPLEIVPVDLTAIAHDAADDARAVDPGRRVEVTATGPAVVVADEAKIRQVVANLVGNALVHTPAGTSITIATGTGTGVSHLEVADEGPGMGPEVAVRAFERFYRADPSRSRHRGGSGLGLAIVEATIRAHGGAVTLDSAPGEGLTVRIELPTPD
ncbi:MAG: sensor histidine kinase [Acidimicrobiales bacterium]